MTAVRASLAHPFLALPVSRELLDPKVLRATLVQQE
jgi:hypothetical protein